MILAYHAIFSCYGFWLPNDPRGSWSDFVRRYELLRFGPATKTSARRSVANTPHDAERRRAAKAALKYPPVVFNGVQARAVARGFAEAMEKSGYTILACSILPDHVHVVLRRHEQRVEQMAGHLKGRATKRLSPPSPWAQKSGWNVYLNSDDDVRRSIRYAERNPVKAGLPPQKWWFVTPWSTP